MNASTIATPAAVNSKTTAALEAAADAFLAANTKAPKAKKLAAPKEPKVKVEKAPKVKHPYPFMSKAQIVARIDSDDDFALECLQVMDGRQTEDEQDAKVTKYKNRCGWMSSHAVNGTTLATKARNEGLDDAEMEKVRGMVRKYGKQLANHIRGCALANNPALAATAKLFGL